MELEAGSLELIITGLAGKAFWVIGGMFLLALLKDTIAHFISGISVFMGHDVDIENLITLENGRKGRVTRHGITKTILISQDKDERTKIIIPNHRLAKMIIEKELPQNGISDIKNDIRILKEKLKELEDAKQNL